MRRISVYDKFYRVRIFRNRKAIVDSSFKFSERGGKAKALKQAKVFRDEQEAIVVAKDGSKHWNQRYSHLIAGLVIENQYVIARLKNKSQYTIERFSIKEFGLRKAFLKGVRSLERRRLNGDKYPVNVVKKSYKLIQARFEELDTL